MFTVTSHNVKESLHAGPYDTQACSSKSPLMMCNKKHVTREWIQASGVNETDTLPVLRGRRVGAGGSCDNMWMALTSSSDEGFAKETETTGGAATLAAVGAGLSCARVGRVRTLPATGCGVWICSTCPVWDSTMGRPAGGRRHKT